MAWNCQYDERLAAGAGRFGFLPLANQLITSRKDLLGMFNVWSDRNDNTAN